MRDGPEGRDPDDYAELWRRLRALADPERWKLMQRQLQVLADPERWKLMQRQLQVLADPERWKLMQSQLEPLADPERWKDLQRQVQLLVEPERWSALREQLRPLRDPATLEALRRSIQPPLSEADVASLEQEAAALDQVIGEFAGDGEVPTIPVEAEEDFAWIDALPTLAQTRLLVHVLSVLNALMLLASVVVSSAVPVPVVYAAEVLIRLAQALMDRLQISGDDEGP